MAESILKNKQSNVDDDASTEMSEEEKKNIQFWAKQDPDGTATKQKEKEKQEQEQQKQEQKQK